LADGRSAAALFGLFKVLFGARKSFDTGKVPGWMEMSGKKVFKILS
jgi:hypothetical protein